jgi:hypothetical protein
MSSQLSSIPYAVIPLAMNPKDQIYRHYHWTHHMSKCKLPKFNATASS